MEFGICSANSACCDGGAHTVYVEYNTDAEKQEAERSVARLWNMGKVIKLDPGE